MVKSGKKLILLENVFQAEEYLKKALYFKNYLPISFDFNVEQLLLKKGLYFKTDDDYEFDSIYKGTSTLSRKLTENICEKYPLKYKGIQLFSLFYYKIYTRISYSQKCLILLKEIIKKECPKEIVIFKNLQGNFLEKEFLSNIAENFFKGKITKHTYKFLDKKGIREKLPFKIISMLQKNYTQFKLKFNRKTSKNIFIFGGKLYFKSLTGTLLKNKKYHLFNFDSILRKSYFSNKRYIPFYEFASKKISNPKLFNIDLNNLSLTLEKNNLYTGFNFKKDLEKNIKLLLINIVQNDFLQIAQKIEEAHFLFKNKKIDLLILAEEDSPLSKIMVKIANKFDIPSIVILHGIPSGDLLFGQTQARYHLVFGEKIKKWFIINGEKYGKQISNVIALGCPRYDSFLNIRKKSDKNQILYAMEIAPEIERVADTHLTKKMQKIALKMIINIMKSEFPNYTLILKIRPNWDLKKMLYNTLKENNFSNFEIIEKANNEKLMGDSKLVIVNHSTMGLESLLIGVPVISLSFKELDFFNSYKNSKIIKVVYTPEQLKKELKKSINSNFLDKNELNKYVLTDKKSTKRVTELIQNIL